MTAAVEANLLPVGECITQGDVNYAFRLEAIASPERTIVQLKDAVWGRPGGGSTRILRVEAVTTGQGASVRVTGRAELLRDFRSPNALRRTREVARRVFRGLGLHAIVPGHETSTGWGELDLRTEIGNDAYRGLAARLAAAQARPGYDGVAGLAFDGRDADDRFLATIFPDKTFAGGGPAIRRARKVLWVPAGVTPSFDEAVAVAKIPADWVPDCPEEWESFIRVMKALAWQYGSCLATLLKSCRGRWRQFEERCLEAASEEGIARDRIDLGAQFRNAGDLLSAASRELGRQITWADVYGDKALPACLSKSAGWHVARRRHAGRHEAEIESQETTWNTLFEPLVIDDVSIECIPDADGLAREGRELGHCVADYADACATGISRILSLRHPGGRSTADLCFPDGKVGIDQHSSFKNAAPDEKCRRALQVLVERLNSGEIEYEDPVRRSWRPGQAPSAPAWTPDEWSGWVRVV